MQLTFKLIAVLMLMVFFIGQAEAVSPLLIDTLKTISSDSYEGRRAGTAGGQKTVAFLEAKLKELQIAPLGKSYLQEFTIFTKMVKTGDNTFSIPTIGAEGKFQPLSISLSGEVKDVEMVFAGFGISIPDSDQNLKYDDYKNLDVKDKVVVVLTGDPGVGNQNSGFRDPKYLSYRSLFYKIKNAATHGAKAVMVVQDPMSLADPTKEPEIFFDDREGGGERFGILAGQVTINYLNQVLAAAGSNFKDTLVLQKEIAKTQNPISFKLGSLTAELKINLKKETGRVSNVMAYIEGTHADLKKEILVIGAHMDHLGYGGHSSMDPRHDRAIHNGADDNASGTALVIDLMDRLKVQRLKHSVVAIFFNAEEMGLLGSEHFVKSWSQFEAEYGKLKGMLNFDMVGRFNKEVEVMGAGSGKEWSEYLSNLHNDLLNSRHAPKLLPMKFSKTAVGSSDHASFIEGKVPSLFFTTGAHEDYHRHTDDFEKIDLLSLDKIRFFAEKLIQYLDLAEKDLTFDPTYDPGNGNGGNRGYGAHLGCVPKFGQSDDIAGVLCTRASSNSPAEAAGIVSGDILVGIGEIAIKNIYDLTFALKYYRAGDKVKLAWMRGETRHEKEVTLTRKQPVSH